MISPSEKLQSGVVLKSLRLEKGLSQKQVALQVGVQQPNYSRLESGKLPIGKTIAKRLAAFFETDYKIFL